MKLVSAHCIYCDEPVFKTDRPTQIGQDRGYRNDWAHGECWDVAQKSFANQESLWDQNGWQPDDDLTPVGKAVQLEDIRDIHVDEP